MRSRSSAAKSLQVVGAFGLSQAAIGLGALVRVPLTINAIGVGGLGVVVVVGALIPIVMLPGAGLRGASRVALSEIEGASRSSGAFVRTRAHGVRRAHQIAAAEIVVLVPVALIDPFDLGGGWSVQLSVVLAVLLSAAALDGMWWWGTLDAQDRLELPSIVVTAVTVVGTGAAVVLAVTDAGLSAFIMVNILTSTTPMFVVSVLGRRFAGPRTRDFGALSPEDRRAIDATIGSLTGRSAGWLLTRGLDPIIINAGISTPAAGVYSVGQRLSLGITLPSMALSPRIATRAAVGRGRGSADSLTSVIRQS